MAAILGIVGAQKRLAYGAVVARGAAAIHQIRIQTGAAAPPGIPFSKLLSYDKYEQTHTRTQPLPRVSSHSPNGTEPERPAMGACVRHAP